MAIGHMNELLEMAQALELDAQKLREAAAIAAKAEGLALVAPKPSNGNGNGHSHPEPQPFMGTRGEQLAAYLKSKGGAATRQEILHEAGMPPGTVSSLLGHRKLFDQDSDGKWHAKHRRAS